MALSTFFVRVSYLLPKKWNAYARDLLVRGGYHPAAHRMFIGLAMVLSVTLGAITFVVCQLILFDFLFSVLAGLMVFSIQVLGLYYMLTSSAFSRGHQIEAVLPDVLRIISSNMRAGMTVENAVWSAARPEFGPLRDEISKVAADTFAGTPIDQALMQMPSRVESTLLDRAIRLMVEGLRLGGRMTDLLDEVAADIASYQNLQNQIATSTTTYSIFILFAALIAAPMLFSVSTFYAEMNEKTLSSVSKPAIAGIGSFPAGAGGPVPLGPTSRAAEGIGFADIRMFSVAVLIVTAFFAAMIIWEIKEGNPRKGLGYSPLFSSFALIVFVAGLFLLESFFSRLI
jgi:flagellar protein FlaJ